MTPRQRRIADYLTAAHALGLHPTLREIATRIDIATATAHREVAVMVERGDLEIIRDGSPRRKVQYRVAAAK